MIILVKCFLIFKNTKKYGKLNETKMGQKYMYKVIETAIDSSQLSPYLCFHL